MKNLKKMAFFNLALAVVLFLFTSNLVAHPSPGSRLSVQLSNGNMIGNNSLAQAGTSALIKIGQSSGKKTAIEVM